MSVAVLRAARRILAAPSAGPVALAIGRAAGPHGTWASLAHLKAPVTRVFPTPPPGVLA